MGNTLVKVSNMNEDIEHTIIDLGDLLHTKSHKEILEFLKDKELQLGKPTSRNSSFALSPLRTPVRWKF